MVALVESPVGPAIVRSSWMSRSPTWANWKSPFWGTGIVSEYTCLERTIVSGPPPWLASITASRSEQSLGMQSPGVGSSVRVTVSSAANATGMTPHPRRTAAIWLLFRYSSIPHSCEFCGYAGYRHVPTPFPKIFIPPFFSMLGRRGRERQGPPHPHHHLDYAPHHFTPSFPRWQRVALAIPLPVGPRSRCGRQPRSHAAAIRSGRLPPRRCAIASRSRAAPDQGRGDAYPRE